uniref:Uncharacterized protein n=1 Tax=Ananas comosus var. bracteatus TaxID=296719 RepID=A0A6V7NSZ4_ANACO|nr:unnamed protein product [Ananas comosus var. bracteatus]
MYAAQTEEAATAEFVAAGQRRRVLLGDDPCLDHLWTVEPGPLGQAQSAVSDSGSIPTGSSDWLCSELFQIFWWVVDCFWPACTGTRLCLYRYKVDGCTGTAIGACTGTEPQSPATRASGLDFVDLVPVQGPVYRYKAADFAQFETAGVFLLL